MAKKSDPGERIKALRMERGQSQQQFADVLGIAQTAVSAWERGEYAPTAEAYLLLGKAASFPDSLWFFERAGLDEQTIFSVAGKILKDRMAPAAPGEIIRIPLVLETGKGIENKYFFALPASLIPKPANTICHVVKKSTAPELALGDIVIVDTSEDQGDLTPFWNQIVLFEFEPGAGHPDIPKRLPEGLFIGRLSFAKYDALGLVWAVYLEGVDQAVGFWSWKPTADNPEVLGRPKDIYRAADEALLHAREDIRLRKGCRIVGRAIGWFKAPGKKEVRGQK